MYDVIRCAQNTCAYVYNMSTFYYNIIPTLALSMSQTPTSPASSFTTANAATTTTSACCVVVEQIIKKAPMIE